jgi:hypothetical protein
MQNLIYIVPHLSTGGMPQYTLKQIETYKNQFNITVIEVNNYSDEYVVQRNKIKNLCHHICLNGDKNKLYPTILELNPYCIHFQEIPESFLLPEVSIQIFKHPRDYYIVTTTHSSLTEPSQLKFIPDEFVLVNKWSQQRFEQQFPEVPCYVWEYPIEDKWAWYDEKEKFHQRQAARWKIGHFSFNKSGTHYLNVGLFTPGKNQGELFEIARKDPNNHYHFVGNQALNFKDYWEPLMQNRPDNCYVWGERDDVDLFYQACDEMIFTSKFELNPLCVKEALSYGLPVKMYKLHTYGSDYDNNPLVTYL